MVILKDAYPIMNNVIEIQPDSNRANYTSVVAFGANIDQQPLAMPQTEAEKRSVSRDNHGFKCAILADGKPGIEATITRPNGTQVTIQLSEGARGTFYNDLAEYGKANLKGATLISQEDFEALVESLTGAIKGLKVVNGVLQTDDEDLIKAHRLLIYGVRRAGGFSRAIFDLDDLSCVSASRVDNSQPAATIGYGAAFVSPPEK
jgi:hypothetical protein